MNTVYHFFNCKSKQKHHTSKTACNDFLEDVVKSKVGRLKTNVVDECVTILSKSRFLWMLELLCSSDVPRHPIDQLLLLFYCCHYRKKEDHRKYCGQLSCSMAGFLPTFMQIWKYWGGGATTPTPLFNTFLLCSKIWKFNFNIWVSSLNILCFQQRLAWLVLFTGWAHMNKLVDLIWKLITF